MHWSSGVMLCYNLTESTNSMRTKVSVLQNTKREISMIPFIRRQVLLAAPTWSFMNLVETYSMIVGWRPLSPIEALELLQPW